MEGLPEYLSSRHYATAQDWPSALLDDAGKSMQEGIQSATLVNKHLFGGRFQDLNG